MNERMSYNADPSLDLERAEIGWQRALEEIRRRSARGAIITAAAVTVAYAYGRSRNGA